MPNWSIKIVPAAQPMAEVPAAFVPDRRDVDGNPLPPGAPLTAQADDSVHWNNTTNEDYWPWPVDYYGNPLPDNQVSNQFGNYLSDRIPAGGPAGRPSRPNYNVPIVPFSGTTINYCCKLHPKVLGQIKVNRNPTT
jgi:hypothetical protein